MTGEQVWRVGAEFTPHPPYFVLYAEPALPVLPGGSCDGADTPWQSGVDPED